MKILVICQYYYPEPFRIHDICEELVKSGHEVTVITGLPNYPMGRIYDGYRHGKKRNEIVNGVNIHRCFTIGRRSGAIWRFLNYYSFSLSSTWYASRLKEEFDTVFVYQLSPIMMANAGIKYKKKHHKKLVMYCLDLWPESLIEGGVKRGTFLYKLFHKISGRIYKQADKILISSKSFADYFSKEFEITETEYLPQYAEDLFIPEMCKKEPNGTVDLMFAGNVGAAQSVGTIIRAAAITQDIENLRWHIVGDGSELDNCKKLAKELDVSSVIFHGRKSVEEMPKYYAMADAMLVTMKKDPVISMTLPGKVQSYMAAGKPIIGAIDGETAEIINTAECGICSPAEDAEKLAENIRLFVTNRTDSQMDIHSRSFYNKYFIQQMFMDRLELYMT